jgi:hypothetical protein
MSLYSSEVEAQHSSPDRITLRRLDEFIDQALTKFTPVIAYEPNTWEPNEVPAGGWDEVAEEGEEDFSIVKPSRASALASQLIEV